MAKKTTATSKQPVIKCESVYKIFGENAHRMMQESNGSIDVEAFKKAGCIFGVNSASFEVHEGEMLVVMGLSGSGKSTLLRCISRLTETTSGKKKGRQTKQCRDNQVNFLTGSFKQCIQLRET